MTTQIKIQNLSIVISNLKLRYKVVLLVSFVVMLVLVAFYLIIQSFSDAPVETIIYIFKESLGQGLYILLLIAILAVMTLMGGVIYGVLEKKAYCNKKNASSKSETLDIESYNQTKNSEVKPFSLKTLIIIVLLCLAIIVPTSGCFFSLGETMVANDTVYKVVIDDAYNTDKKENDLQPKPIVIYETTNHYIMSYYILDSKDTLLVDYNVQKRVPKDLVQTENRRLGKAERLDHNEFCNYIETH